MAEVSCGAAAYCVSNALVRESHTVVFFTCLSVHLRINVSKLRGHVVYVIFNWRMVLQLKESR